MSLAMTLPPSFQLPGPAVWAFLCSICLKKRCAPLLMTPIGKEQEPKLIWLYLLVQIQLYPVIPIAKEKLVDTNGAGDAFVGGKPSAPYRKIEQRCKQHP